jgi:hypothetical protein
MLAGIRLCAPFYLLPEAFAPAAGQSLYFERAGHGFEVGPVVIGEAQEVFDSDAMRFSGDEFKRVARADFAFEED